MFSMSEKEIIDYLLDAFNTWRERVDDLKRKGEPYEKIAFYHGMMCAIANALEECFGISPTCEPKGFVDVQFRG